MTYVEFYDKNSIENICACLEMTPDKVILVGSDRKAIEKQAKNCQKVFLGRGQDVEFSYKPVSRWSTADIVETLEDIIKNNKDCVFGITGGDEMVIFALGMVCERNRDKNIQVHKINIENNIIHDCDMDGKKIGEYAPVLSVEENVQIYGGSIDAYDWDMSTDFQKDIDNMWNICKVNPTSWNAQIGVFSTVKKRGTCRDDGLTIEALVGDLEYYYENHDGSYHINGGIKHQLIEKKLLSKCEEKEGKITITFKNKQVKKCLTQAGQVLEMKIYHMSRRLKDKRTNEYIYNDVRTGVTIDWDGYEQPVGSQIVDTVNEIDVLMMHSMVPVFVSCKNGGVSSDELYKLNTVAEQFGGKYAKKVLVSSCLSSLYNGEEVKQRAKDMGIKIITDVNLMTDEKLANMLGNVWR